MEYRFKDMHGKVYSVYSSCPLLATEELLRKYSQLRRWELLRLF